MRLFNTVIFVCTYILFTKCIQAQQTTPASYTIKPIPVIFVTGNQQSLKGFQDLISKSGTDSIADFRILYLDNSGLTIYKVTDWVNRYINNTSDIDRQRLYLIGSGSHQDSLLYTNLDKRVFAATFFYTEGKSSSGNVANWFKEMRKKYLWEIDLLTIEETGKERIYKKKNFVVGPTLGFNTKSPIQSDSAFLPSGIKKAGVSGMYTLSRRIFLSGHILFSLQIPNKNKLQNDLKSQLKQNVTGSQRVSVELKSHALVNSNFQANYHFGKNDQKGFSAGAGFSLIAFTSAYKKIKKSISISDLSGGGGLPDIGNTGTIPSISGFSISPSLSTSYQFRISENTRFFLQSTFDFQKARTIKGIQVENGIENLSFSVSLLFNLTGKPEYFYHFLKIKH